MPNTSTSLAALAEAMQQHAARSESLRTAFRAIATGQAHALHCAGPHAAERHAFLLDQLADLLEYIAPDCETVHEQRCIAVARLGVLACAAQSRYGEHSGMIADIGDTMAAALAFVSEWRPESDDHPKRNDCCPLCTKPMVWMHTAQGPAGEVLVCEECGFESASDNGPSLKASHS